MQGPGLPVCLGGFWSVRVDKVCLCLIFYLYVHTEKPGLGLVTQPLAAPSPGQTPSLLPGSFNNNNSNKA